MPTDSAFHNGKRASAPSVLWDYNDVLSFSGGSMHSLRKAYRKLPQESNIANESSMILWLTRNILPFKGYLFGVLAAFSYTITNVFVSKGYLLTSSDHLVILFIVVLFVTQIIIVFRKENLLGPSGKRVGLVLRGVFNLGAVGCLYIALRFIPPSDCIAVRNSCIIITAILSRFIFKEKLGLVHVLAIVLTILGILFISKPSFLFVEAILRYNESNLIMDRHDSAKEGVYDFAIGISMAALCALIFSFNFIAIKKLCNDEVHWSVQIAYTAYVGLPISLAVSFTLYLTKMAHTYLHPHLYIHMLYSLLSTIFCLFGTISINLAFLYEDVSKVTIVKTIDVLFSFVLQYLILHVLVDRFTIIGSLSILLGVFIVFVSKIVEIRLNAMKSKSCLKTVFLFKF